MMWKTLRSAFSLLLVISAVASAQQVEMVDGVRVVHNKKGSEWGNGPKLSIELVRTIGDVDTKDENLAFNSPGDLVVDKNGNIYILDGGNQRVQVFGEDGRYVRTIGRRGQGPGEFSDPNSLDIDREGRLHVLDKRQRRIQVFATNGEVLKSVRTPGFGYGIDKMRLLRSGALVIRTIVGFGLARVQKVKSVPRLLKLLSPEIEVQREFGEGVDFGDEITNASLNSCDFAVDNGDEILVCLANQNRLEKFSPEGRLLWRADRELNFSTKLIERGEQKITSNGVTYIWAKFNRVAVSVAVDDKGRAWAVTCDRQIRKEEVITNAGSGSPSGMTRKIEGDTDLRTTDMFKLEVFGPDGVLLGEIPLTHFVDQIAIYEDRLFLLDRDRGVTYYEYRIREAATSAP
jgi:sugar lactone lactonase YvrE